MPDQPSQERSVAKVRAGLAVLGLVVVVALGMMATIGSPAGKAVMFAIAATVLVRAYLLYRSLRREQAAL